MNTLKTNDEDLYYEKSLLSWYHELYLSLYWSCVIKSLKINMAFALLLIYYTERNFVISYDLSNTIHTCFIHEACFYFDKDSFTWYNYLSVLLNLNKEVYSSFANAWLNTNHETISLHSYNWNKSLIFIPVCAVKYLIHVLYKTCFRSPELWKCNILTSLRLLVSNMRKYNFNFFFFIYIVAFISLYGKVTIVSWETNAV